ncbi:MAG: UDP-2,4-diacetamido-2,4,6-trideoxy-beta-L-altropyranose hydrolase [Chloroflexi bacterium]|nr:UDP-2,4-diacetamido-2,4,6-trideoxy-beta-L-altropyranose hydrolase [Chloroflexota bacterium]
MSRLLLIRADASPEMGTGHVMRCLALAEVWRQSGGDVTLLSAALPPALRQRAESAGVSLDEVSAAAGSLTDAEATIALAAAARAAWVMMDGYHFNAAFQRALKQAGLRLLVVDDYGSATHYCADLILNQNLGARADLYASREPYSRLLLGPRYVLLRGEFLSWHAWRREIPVRARRVLVTLGGSDPENVTLKVLQALRQLMGAAASDRRIDDGQVAADNHPASATDCPSCDFSDLEVTVVVGGSNPHFEHLKSQISDSRFRLLRDIANMPELMSAADLAIAAGGSTAWELAFMGLPMLIIVLAENQRSNGQQLHANGLARHLGWHADLTPDRLAHEIESLLDDAAARAEMSRRGRALVDGLGGFRVWLHLNEDTLCLRSVTADDCRLVWEWANDTGVRAASFSSEPIPWENHVAWFSARLADPDCRFWLATDTEQRPVGQVRFNMAGREATISVSLDAGRRGKHLGALLIWLACRKLFREAPVEMINAFIKPGNAMSIRAFEKSGFEKAGAKEVKNQAALLLQLARHRAEI